MFSRNCDTQRDKFWQVQQQLESNFAERGVADCILDGEIVYVDENNNFMAF